MEFQSSVRDIDIMTKEIRGSVPAEAISAHVERSLVKLAARSPLKGFRPGKTPINLLRKTYGARLDEDASVELAGDALVKVLTENELRVVGEPDWTLEPREPGGALSFSAKVYVIPEPMIAGAEAFQISVPKRQVTEEVIDKTVEELRQKNQVFVHRHDARGAEDRDTVELSATLIAPKDHQSKPQAVRLTLGVDPMPPELGAALRGMTVGASKRVSLQPPQTNEGKKNKKASAQKQPAKIVYDITVTAIGELVLPDVDDTFAARVEPTTENVAQLRAIIAERLQSSFDAQARDAVRSQILNLLVERNTFDVPPPLIDHEVANLARQFGGAEASKLSWVTLRNALGEVASGRARAQIIVDQIAKDEKVNASTEDVSALIAEQAIAAGQPIAAFERWVASSEGRLDAIRKEVLRTKVLDLLETRATITYEDAPADDVVTDGAPEGGSFMSIPDEHTHDCSDPHCDHSHHSPLKNREEATAE
jgi:trigger factor